MRFAIATRDRLWILGGLIAALLLTLAGTSYFFGDFRAAVIIAAMVVPRNVTAITSVE